MTAPSFSLSVFQVRAQEHVADKAAAQNALTQKLYEILDARNDISITKTLLNGVLSIRFAVGAVRTEERHIDYAFQLIQEQAKNVISNHNLEA